MGHTSIHYLFFNKITSMVQFCKLVIFISSALSSYGRLNPNKFPDDFLFGIASASYQIEGAWNLSGKGENIWDRYTHTHPELILNRTNGDIACNSYHRYEEDVALIKKLGVQFYRFSLSWTRILPIGFSSKINPDGIRYYNNLINLLMKNDIIPIITIFHWDTPQHLEELGGFTNALMANWFEDYARVVFENFGDRVKVWITFNEPKEICLKGYGGDEKAPGYNLSGTADYICAHNLMKAHARAYHLYDKQFRSKQNGQISIVMDTFWMEPATNLTWDKKAAERRLAFIFGWYAHPVYSSNGDYPDVMKKYVARRSKREGFKRSRLPNFTKEEVNYIKGTYDFLGLNHYSTVLTKNVLFEPIFGKPSVEKDSMTVTEYDPSWPNSKASWLKVVPWGFTKLLVWLKNAYGNVPIYITENGFADDGEIDDKDRINYHKLYLSALLDAMHKYKVNVKAYTIWSFMDDFEWRDGYMTRFGLYHVDFNDPGRNRTPKASAEYYRKVIAARKIDGID
ncbi:hypothetical protein ILUMI_19908 [Ignelater luminosus]|uniref:beta-glucosidase n=1 Tax=Ignelater luminosus TaxID=2038154 RepID=A0A8K0CF97_IGNLU|nr:hypothetical protein ILUMI_19908 [Ignelater luminosus]